MKKVINGYYKINDELVKVTTSEIIDGSADIQKLENKLSELEYSKQDSINDIDTIRSNADKGASLSSSVILNTTNINNLQSSINIINGNSTVEGSIDYKISEVLSNPNYTYSTEDIEAGSTALETGKIYIVYE